MLDLELKSKNIQDIKTSISGPTITHLMYADDIMLFSRATKKDASTISNILEKYCAWSGQSVNRAKSGIFFSKHTLTPTRRTIRNILQVKSLKKDAVYLGAPLILSRSPTKDFAFLQSKLESKLAGWRSKCLSWAGRRTLITSVAQTLPTYTMSTFNVPSIICDKIDSLTRRFWWKPNKLEGNFLAWRAWDKLCHLDILVVLVSRKPRTLTTPSLLSWPG